MFQFISVAILIAFSLMEGVSAEWCYSGYSSYYCSPGQSCGYSYGDCRGLPTYAIITIISTSILLLSICIRCCIHMNNTNKRPAVVQNPGLVRVQVNSFGNNGAVRPPVTTPIHNVVEEAPPNYEAISRKY